MIPRLSLGPREFKHPRHQPAGRARWVHRSDSAAFAVSIDGVSRSRDCAFAPAVRAVIATTARTQLDERATARTANVRLALSRADGRGVSRDPGRLLQRLVDVVTGICGVSTAAVAMRAGNPLHWDAAAGRLADSPRSMTFHHKGIARRDAASPTPASDSASRQVFSFCPSPVPDARAIPLHHGGELVGVLWIANDEAGGTFTAAAEHAVRTLARLVSSAWTTWAEGQAVRRVNDRMRESLALVSHELRSPLNVIAVATALFRNRVSIAGPVARVADLVARQCRLMSRVIGDLSDTTARLDHGKFDLEVTEIDVRAVVSEVVATRRHDIELSGQTLTVSLGEIHPAIEADPIRLEQMLSNLLDNAVTFSPQSGRIDVSLRGDSDSVHLAVQDDGCGMSADQLPGIFEPLAQLESSRAAAGYGLGLGALIDAAPRGTPRWHPRSNQPGARAWRPLRHSPAGVAPRLPQRTACLEGFAGTPVDRGGPSHPKGR